MCRRLAQLSAPTCPDRADTDVGCLRFRPRSPHPGHESSTTVFAPVRRSSSGGVPLLSTSRRPCGGGRLEVRGRHRNSEISAEARLGVPRKIALPAPPFFVFLFIIKEIRSRQYSLHHLPPSRGFQGEGALSGGRLYYWYNRVKIFRSDWYAEQLPCFK